MSGAIKVQVGMGGTVAKVTLNRPDRFNAFDREMIRELGDLVRGVEESSKLRVLVLTGEGKAFSAGGDLQAAKSSDSVSNYLGQLARGFHSVLETLSQSPALVVSLVNGPAVGGGLSLALAADLRLALPEATFRVGYGRAGLTMDGGLSWRLPRIVGLAQAQRLVFEDAEVGAEEAKALGLVHRVVATADLVKTLEELVQKASAQSRASVMRNRQLLAESGGRTLGQTFEAETLLLKTSAGSSDGREGIQAFLEKRPPKFTS
jgi:2-(1,2-epoxy-1,2-dihydrophenyl)acetyl-CoA isomerase